MKYKNIPEQFKEEVNSLKHGSTTIENDVTDAIETSSTWEEAVSYIKYRMDKLMAEAKYTKQLFS